MSLLSTPTQLVASNPSLWSRLVGTTLGGLGTIGNVLDTPGSVIRGLLAGKTDRAFSGIFDWDKRVSGSELIGKDPNKFSWGGLGVEVLTDPLTFLTFGSLTGAGKLAQTAGKLAPRVKAAQVFGRDTAKLAERLAKVEGKLNTPLAFKPGLSPTLSGQAVRGQRSLVSAGIPFTDLNVTLVKGTRAFEGLDKAGAALSPLGRIFNTTDKFDEQEKAIKAEFNYALSRSEAEAGLAQRDINGKLKAISKKTGIDRKTLEKQLANEIEISLASDTPATTPLASDLLKLRLMGQQASGAAPLEISALANEIKSKYSDLLKQGKEEFIPEIDEYGGMLGYLQRQLTPKGKKLLDKKPKETITTLTDALRVAKEPGFVKQRKLFRNTPVTILNDALKKKYKVDYDIFNTDIPTVLASRIYQQGTSVAQGKVFDAYLRLKGKAKNTVDAGDRTNIVNLLRKTGNSKEILKGGFKNKYSKEVEDKFRTVGLLDSEGRLINTSSQEGRKLAAEVLRSMRKISKKGSNPVDVLHNDLGNLGITKEQIEKVLNKTPLITEQVKTLYKPFAEKISKSFDELKEVAKEISNKYNVKFNTNYFDNLDISLSNYIPNLPIEDHIKYANKVKQIVSKKIDASQAVEKIEEVFYQRRKPLKDKLNLTNKLWHGTNDVNYKDIKNFGMIPKKAPDKWPSTGVAGFEPATYFTPKKEMARTFALDSLKRAKGAIESSQPYDSILENSVKGIQGKARSLDNDLYRFVDEVTNSIIYHPERIDDLDLYLNNEINRLENLLSKNTDIDPLVKEDFKAEFISTLAETIDLVKNKPTAPVTLETKLSHLLGFDLLKPNVKSQIKGFEKGTPLGKYDLKQLGLDKKYGKDFNEMEQIMAGKVPANLLKDTNSFEAYKLTDFGKKKEIKEIEDIVTWNKGTKFKEISEKLNSIGFTEQTVTKQEFENARKILTIPKEPEWISGFTRLVDNVNASYRGLLTALVPAYHARNALSGIFMNTLAGVGNPTYYAKAMSALPKLSKEEKLHLQGLKVLGKGQHEEAFKILTESDIGQRNLALKLFKPGRIVGQAVDDVNRYTLYLANKAKGLTDEEAAEQVIKYHFDYDDLTGIEKKVFKRAVLFYTFTRKNFPLMMKSLLEKPVFMQAYNRAVGNTNTNIVEPTWMKDAFFLGENEKGEERRLSIGLPPSELNKFDPNDEGLRKFAQLFASNLTPLVSGSIEALTGTNLYFGEPIQGDLLKRAANISPFSRFYGIAERGSKDLGAETLRTLTGLTIKDVPKDQKLKNEIAKLKTILDQKVMIGKAQPVKAYGNAKDDPEVAALLKRLNRLYRERNASSTI